ncbi:MAG TPA: DinB family protein [Flavobacterium sp.]|jgi:hypothetical protein
MQHLFEITRTSRNTLEKFLDVYTTEQLNTIPPGFSNNLIWNIAHIIVVQQMLVYKLAGLPMMISDEMVEKYKRGTRPEGDISAEEIAEVRLLLYTTIDQTETDFTSGKFAQYHEFTTMSGFTIRSASEATAFNIYHEAVHTGMMMSIRKFFN